MKKVLLALCLVVVMASSAFAAINLEVVGLLNGGSLVDYGASKTNVTPLQATAVSFGITDDIDVAVGAIMITADDDYGKAAVLGLYLNGFYKLMQTGAVAQKIGLEASMLSESEAKVNATAINIVYRLAAQVLGPISLLTDVELVSLKSSSLDGATQGSTMTLLNAAKVGLSIPIM